MVIAWEPSRADRDLETWVAFVAKCRTRGVLVHVTGEEDTLDPRNPSHWRRLIDGGVDAAMESEKISKRVRRGVAAAADKGGFHGDTPYGYQRRIVGERSTAHGPKPIKVQEPHPETAPIAIEIITRLAKEDPIVAIVADLNSRGIPAPTGGIWNRRTTRNMALQVAYLGMRSHKGELHDGCWPAISSDPTWPVTFNAARAVVTRPGRKTSKPGRLKWLLSYLITAPCGGPLRYQGSDGGRVARYRCLIDGCTSVPVTDADEIMTRMVIARFCQPDARDLITRDDDGPALAAQAEASALRMKLKEAEDSFMRVDGTGISASIMAATERRLNPLIEDADRRSKSASVPMAARDMVDAAKGGPGAVRVTWESLPIAARREILKMLFVEIRIALSPGRIARSATDNERLDAAGARITVLWAGSATP